MALMVGSLYDALKDAKVDDAKARAAAEDVANYDGRINGIENRLERIDGGLVRLDQKMSERFTFLQWMIGFNIALSLGVLWRVLA